MHTRHRRETTLILGALLLAGACDSPPPSPPGDIRSPRGDTTTFDTTDTTTFDTTDTKTTTMTDTIHPDLPPDTPTPDYGTSVGTFELVCYWMAMEVDHPGPPEVALEGDGGQTLAMVSQGFADAIMLEGSGELIDGRILNLLKACPDAPTGWCYFEVDPDQAPYGMGSQLPLEPFRSVALDPSHGLASQILYAPALDGVILPTAEFLGPVHDGCLAVADTGWSLGADQVDLFVYLEAYHSGIGDALDADSVELFRDSPHCP